MGPNHRFHAGSVADLETPRQVPSFPYWKTTPVFPPLIVSDMGTPPKRPAQPVFRYYIKEWMKHDGWSDDRMAEELGLSSRSAVWKQYKSPGGVSDVLAAKIARALGRSPHELLFPPGTPSLDALAEGVSPEVRAAMLADVAKHLKNR